jgi:hypothetical protein
LCFAQLRTKKKARKDRKKIEKHTKEHTRKGTKQDKGKDNAPFVGRLLRSCAVILVRKRLKECAGVEVVGEIR